MAKLALKFLLWSYAAIAFIFAVFSYALTAPNLILSSWAPFWRFQTWMWATFFNNRPLLSGTYLVIIALIFSCYLGLVILLTKTKSTQFHWLTLPAILIAFFLLVANNALSYDVFNYIFNAKMVAVYHANPHVQVALDFVQDPWVRFMHNTHTPAPYGYGWTGLSLLPYYLGLGKFLPTWLFFKLFSLVSLVGLGAVLNWHLKANQQAKRWLWLLLLNPLLLIEVLSSAHNDLWMILPALVALLLLIREFRMRRWPLILLSLTLLIFSVSIKFATLTLVPLWVVLLMIKLKVKVPFKTQFLIFWPVLASLLIFVPLFTLRSQQFHPWYLIWSLSFLPLLMAIEKPQDKLGSWLFSLNNLWQILLITFSFTSLLRYLPYLTEGNYTATVLGQQKLITWSALLIGIAIFIFLKAKKYAS